MNLSLFWILRMNVWSFLLYGVACLLLPLDARVVTFLEMLRQPDSPLGNQNSLGLAHCFGLTHPEGPAYSNSETTSYICRQLFFDSCYCFGLHHFLLVQSLSHHVCLQAMSNTGTNFLSSIYDAKVA